MKYYTVSSAQSFRIQQTRATGEPVMNISKDLGIR